MNARAARRGFRLPVLVVVAALVGGAVYLDQTAPGAVRAHAAVTANAVRAAKADGRFDGFVALGCVIRGETTHYDHICAETARALQDMATTGGLAVGYGILTVENEAQALVRAALPGLDKDGRDTGGRDKGGEAVRACLALVELKRRFLGNAG